VPPLKEQPKKANKAKGKIRQKGISCPKSRNYSGKKIKKK